MASKPAPQGLAPLTDAVLTKHPNLRPQVASHVPPGWDLTVARALDDIGALSAASGVSIQVAQIKEKFGLRIYLEIDECSAGGLEIVKEAATHTHLRSSNLPGSVRERATAIVDAAATRCDTLCEVCGNEGRSRNNSGWFRVACDAHSATR